MKHSLGAVGASGTYSRKCSACSVQAENVLSEAFNCMGMAEEVAEMHHRWADPGATTFPGAINPLPFRLPHPSRGPTAANRFAKDMNWFWWHSCCAEVDNAVLRSKGLRCG